MDSIPNPPYVYVQPSVQEDALDRARRENRVDSLDGNQKSRMERALEGIKIRGHQMYLPEASLPIFAGKKGDSTYFTHIMRHGTFTETVGLDAYAERYDAWIDKGEIPSINSNDVLTGNAWMLGSPDSSGIQDCVVVLNLDGGMPTHPFTDFESPVIYPRNMTNFYLQTHEMEHCLYQPEYADEKLADRYLKSVREISGDLSSIFHYARETGTFDIFKALIEPKRLVEINDIDHTTAFALAEILSGYDPAKLKDLDRDEIIRLVETTMANSFEDGKGFIRPEGSPMPTTAMLALSKELKSRDALIYYNRDTLSNTAIDMVSRSLGKDAGRFAREYLGEILIPDAKSYAQKALASLRLNHKAYIDLQPEPAQATSKRSLSGWIYRYRLSDVLEISNVEDKAIVPKKDETLQNVIESMMGL